MAASRIQKLASELANAEGGKSSVLIGDVREILRLLVLFEARLMADSTTEAEYASESPLEELSRRATALAKRVRR